MKNKIASLIILTFVFLVAGFSLKVIAQGTPGENTAAPAADEASVQEAPAADTPASAGAPTLQRSAKSNVSCVKVGAVSDEDKPAICNALAPGGPRPQAPPANGDLQAAIQQKFNISMIGYDQQHLQWAWEKFWEVSNTNFNSLVSGAVIQITDVSSTRQVDCPPKVSVLAGAFPEETAFKHILTHELGHVIRNCAGREKAQETAFLNARKEGGVSYYAQNANACTGSDAPSEDYAEMIAFYLNPGVPVASYLKCYQSSQSRYTEQEFPLHYQVARDILGNY